MPRVAMRWMSLRYLTVVILSVQIIGNKIKLSSPMLISHFLGITMHIDCISPKLDMVSLWLTL
jgi:hypothetical protein